MRSCINAQEYVLHKVKLSIVKKGDECTYHNHIVFAIKRWSRVVIIKIGCFEAGQAIKLVLCPFPHITIHIVKPHGRWGEHIHRLGEEKCNYTQTRHPRIKNRNCQDKLQVYNNP